MADCVYGIRIAIVEALTRAETGYYTSRATVLFGTSQRVRALRSTLWGRVDSHTNLKGKKQLLYGPGGNWPIPLTAPFSLNGMPLSATRNAYGPGPMPGLVWTK